MGWPLLLNSQYMIRRRLKGHCHDKAHVRSWLTPFFLTNKNRNTITRVTNLPRVSLEFHVPFENLLSAGIWAFVCKEYYPMLFMLCEGGVCWIQIQTLYFLPTCIDFSDVRPPIFCSFFFLSKQDGYGAKEVFVSSRFENPLSRKV